MTVDQLYKSMPVTALPDLHMLTIRTCFDGRWRAFDKGANVIAIHKSLGGLLAELTKTMKEG